LNPLLINSPFDLIIGKPTLFTHNILFKVHSQFWGAGLTSVSKISQTCARSSSSLFSVKEDEYEFVNQQLSTSKQLLAVLSEKRDLLDYVIDSEGVEFKDPEFDWAHTSDEFTLVIPKAIFGDMDFQ
jgi:hypothetical protein